MGTFACTYISKWIHTFKIAARLRRHFLKIISQQLDDKTAKPKKSNMVSFLCCCSHQMLTQLQSLAALKIGLFFCHRAKHCFSFPSLLAMTVFFPHRRNSLSCIGAKRNLSNPAGLIEFCFCDYNLNASKITLKGFI